MQLQVMTPAIEKPRLRFRNNRDVFPPPSNVLNYVSIKLL